MATSKRKRSRRHVASAPVPAPAAPFVGLAQPTAGAPGTYDAAGPAAAAESLRRERAAMRRPALIAGLAAGLLLLVVAPLAFRPLGAVRPVNVAPAATVPAVSAPTAAIPVVAHAPTVAPAPTAAAPTQVAPTAAAAQVAAPNAAAPAQVAPTAAAAQVAAPNAAAQVVPNAAAQVAPNAAATSFCVAVAGLPVFGGATCTDYDVDHDDGLVKHENTYATGASVDEVRRFYEAAFASNGWAVTEFQQDIEDNSWEYTVAQTLRRVEVKVQPDLTPAGVVTEITIAEK